jgi:N-acetylneuraminic acid mutarotase
VKTQSNRAAKAHLIRGAFYLLLLAAICAIPFALGQRPARGQRTPTFAERVSYQRAIEEVYWRHRIWPKERPDPKPSLDAVMSQAQLENKVADYLRKSQALEEYWRRPITAEQLQAEMDRMAQHTKQPEVLRELFEALGNDPFVSAECLARPVLAERLLTSWNGYYQKFDGNLRQPTEETLKVITASTSYVLPAISDGCMENTWTGTAGEPDGRDNHTAAWTGTEMIIWGGGGFGVNTGGRYNPTTDTWTPTSTTNAPTPRYSHTAVWTGTEMIVWGGWGGGSPVTNTGARYNPDMDSWTATSTTNAPTARVSHAAVWTGTEMIIWGGWNGINTYFDTGGRYDPNTDTWTATTTNNAPSARYWSSAMWTGSEMIVWGGFDFFTFFNTGGKYDPVTDSWTATSTTNAPDARAVHTAVWTGSEMIVWGGEGDAPIFKNTGGRYNPSTNSWTATGIPGAPDGRDNHTAVWTGTEMIIWGGYTNEGRVNTGGRYNPSTASWISTGNSNAPSSRVGHTAVWTGSEMIVWGGARCNSFLATCLLNTGGRYVPSIDSWTATSTANAPSGRSSHTAVWTGNEMVIWGGGGSNGFTFSSGGKYNPGTDSWTPTSTTNAPRARYLHTAVWTGSEMIVWGGLGGFVGLNTSERDWKPRAGSTPTPTPNFNTGARYNPNTDSWIATSTTNAPTGRDGHTAVWTDTEMIVWGGESSSGNLNSGGRYNPITDSWTPTSTTNAPDARSSHTGVWTGTEMIVWGGFNQFELNTGGRYDPTADSWTAHRHCRGARPTTESHSYLDRQ